MRFRELAGLALVLWSSSARAQMPENPQQIVNLWVQLCVGGGHIETVTGGGTGGVELSLRALDVKGQVKGNYDITKSEAQGLVNGITNALSEVAAAEADKVRVCLQPVRERLLDIVLPPRGQSTKSFTTGTLIPGHDPSPPSPCGPILPDALTLYFGTNAAVPRIFPATVIRIRDKDILIMNRNEKKEISVNLYIYGSDGRYIVTLINNNFDLNPHNEWTKQETSDRTSLIVYDRQHIKVLDVKYFNEAAVRVMGIFRYGADTITIDETQIKVEPGDISGRPGDISGNCMMTAAPKCLNLNRIGCVSHAPIS